MGCEAFTIQVRLAGVASVLPAASVARTSNVCDPLARFEYAFGDAQAAHAPASRRHSNVEPVSVDVNVKFARRRRDRAGRPARDVVSGGVVSGGGTFTVHVRVAGVASVFPAASVARTSNVCEPLARPEYAFGDVQVAHAPASSRHSNVEPVSRRREPEARERVVDVPDGPELIVVSGAVMSGGAATVQRPARRRGVGVSGGVGGAHVERVRAVGQVEYAFGDVQAPHAPASRRHWNVEPVSVEVNVKLAEFDVTVPVGPAP